MDVDEDHPLPSTDVDKDERSILTLPKKYDVFISFRGEDTRNTFTSHLYKALKNAGIQAFNDQLERGQEIFQALFDAVENSKFSIVIFSENYSSSSWCLDELVHILRCRENKTQIVLPVFYHVDPSDVRGQKRSYASAFENHERRYKDTVIGEWKAALTTAATLSGWHLSNNKDDADLVTKIVNHIRGLLNSTSSKSSDYHLKGLFGIDQSVADLDKLLSKDNAPIVGIWGMGGVGKTTLAEVMFEKIRHHFDGHCFLRNVREERQKYGSDFVIQFFERLSGEKEIKVEHLGSIKDRLYRKKLLIVLDDVDDDLDDYNSLLEDRDAWLNSESKVIITSRNRQVLRNIIGDEKMIYHLDILNENEALQIFHFHAFKGKSVDESYTEISRKFVDYANGLPLTLKVLGSRLFGKNREVWESYLNKLEREEPDQKVQKQDMDDGEPSILASQPKNYDVFINFRGEDTRTIISFLCKRLKDNGINAYIETGEEISTDLLDAIEDSKFSVVIFSKNYATSSWCLNELDHIMKCEKKKMQIVFPVFYDVDRASVRKQEESYANAFVLLEKCFSVAQIQKWRTALTNAANLSGWDSSNFRNDDELVEKIVKHIRGELKSLFGMPKRVEDVNGLLKIGSKVGICGVSGLGKTTLAQAVLIECRDQFHRYCFLRNVGENVKKHGVAYLVEKMIKGLSKEENGVLDDAKKKMLYQKKLLLVLDDVDSLIDYEALLEDERDWFNSESKVIITSRDKQVLRNICNGNENIYDL